MQPFAHLSIVLWLYTALYMWQYPQIEQKKIQKQKIKNKNENGRKIKTDLEQQDVRRRGL